VAARKSRIVEEAYRNLDTTVSTCGGRSSSAPGRIRTSSGLIGAGGITTPTPVTVPPP